MSTYATHELARRLPALSLRDEQRLGRRLDGARRIRKPEARDAVLAEISAEIDRGEQRIAARSASVPEITYPENLPVSQKKDEILAAIRDHQVVIVAGETGSGKTTQIPKICLELGRGVRGLIGHTQPRRIAARTVAERVAEELRTPLGEAVGWKVRFTDQVGDRTLVKLMTDGIMLAEIQTDRELRAYDTIIIDEAHERSLNIDFILGYLAQLLPRRPDLKVVITSATIDPERFSRHFGGAPIVEVSGRTYPVEVRYRPLLEEGSEDTDRDQITAICDAVDELQAEGPGDILVFLSGEREIRDTADALTKKQLRHTEVLPLYARLSSAEQHRVFQQHAGRRVVLATNVAETSLTVPGIRYVIDPGTARISRYSHRTKVQRLPIEPISQASANQRKGRCGRTSDGICVRLYDEDDFLSRPEFTDAEILRTNLASVILQMTAAGLGDISRFPFIDPPDSRNIKDGVQLLEELGALDAAQKDPRKRLTQTGRKLAQLPVDPRLARMVLEAERNGCVREVMVIAAALSIQDPRERPADKQQQADQQHARFRDESSDFLAFLHLWTYVRDRQKDLSSSAFRRMCRNEFLNYLRIREWQDIYSQLKQVARSLGMEAEAADRQGFRALRVLAQMERVWPDGATPEQVAEQEFRLDALVGGGPAAMVVCAYPGTAFLPGILEQAAGVHPHFSGRPEQAPSFHLFSSPEGYWNVSGIVDADGADAFHTAVTELLRTTPTLRLSCRGLELMDAAGMQKLAKAAVAVPGRRVLVEDPNPTVRKCWELLGFADPSIPVELAP